MFSQYQESKFSLTTRFSEYICIMREYLLEIEYSTRFIEKLGILNRLEFNLERERKREQPAGRMHEPLRLQFGLSKHNAAVSVTRSANSVASRAACIRAVS